MSLAEFHSGFLDNLRDLVAEHFETHGKYPSEELIFAEMVMSHLEDAYICDDAEVCHWSGMVERAKTRISGYSLSQDETRLDLFIANYLGTDHLSRLTQDELRAITAQGWRFIAEAAQGRLRREIASDHPVQELLAIIAARWNDLDQVRLIVMTDAQSEVSRISSMEAEGKIVRLEVIDIVRLQQHVSGRARDEIAISFPQTLGRPLPCVHVPEPEVGYDYALTAIPGEVIRALYETYSTRLLEQNVRTFLSARKKVNKGIANTLKDDPAQFMAFNNGLVLVCDDARFERCADGEMGITLLSGVQIVNGGQTTASIYFTARANKGLDLSRVHVPAKIIIPRQNSEDARTSLVRDVSRFANSQNSVKTSDLSANRPFHIQLEKLANETFCPDGTTRWFYERADGAYNVMMLREATTPAARRKLRLAIPPSQRLTKNDVARYLEAWRGQPAQVALAGEKNFAAFMAALDTDPTLVPQPLSTGWYREMIAKVILFRALSAAIKRKEMKDTFRQGYVNITAYTVAVLAEKLGNRIDLEMIWAHQGLSQEFEAMVVAWARVVNRAFEEVGAGRQFSELAKRPELWPHVQNAEFPSIAADVPEFGGI